MAVVVQIPTPTPGSRLGSAGDKPYGTDLTPKNTSAQPVDRKST
jgi:hypothetical protein